MKTERLWRSLQELPSTQQPTRVPGHSVEEIRGRKRAVGEARIHLTRRHAGMRCCLELRLGQALGPIEVAVYNARFRNGFRVKVWVSVLPSAAFACSAVAAGTAQTLVESGAPPSLVCTAIHPPLCR